MSLASIPTGQDIAEKRREERCEEDQNNMDGRMRWSDEKYTIKFGTPTRENQRVTSMP